MPAYHAPVSGLSPPTANSPLLSPSFPARCSAVHPGRAISHDAHLQAQRASDSVPVDVATGMAGSAAVINPADAPSTTATSFRISRCLDISPSGRLEACLPRRSSIPLAGSLL